MAWTTLSMRNGECRQNASEITLQKTQLSRQLRNYQRTTQYQQTIFENDKKQELRTAKDPLDAKKDSRPDIDSDDYAKWSQEYNDLKEDYEAKKVDINDYYDGIANDLEEESTDEETNITVKQDRLQSILDMITQEQEAVKEQTSTDIKSESLSFS